MRASTIPYPWSPTWRRVRDHARGVPVVPLAIIAGVLVAALFADVLAPFDPELGNLRHRHRPPAWVAGGDATHLLGTDHLGRDILSRLLYGARISLVVGFTAAVVAGALGTAVGIVSGYVGRWVDQVIMRVVDAWIALPAISFAIFLAVLLGPSERNIVIILAAIFWTRYARVIRGEVLSLKEREYVRLAIVAGCSNWTIMRRHILPNVLNTSIVLSTLIVGVVIVAEAALSFLGVGVPPPKPAWGLMLSDGKEGLMAGYWWVTLFPGLAIMLVVLAANLLGDWLRVKLDPQLRQL
ncbi:MAG TPA: ABC transporter permease [Gemmatimonadales bacterium]|nr:ABC transporter permease [Gemmatimonadales bacterium]